MNGSWTVAFPKADFGLPKAITSSHLTDQYCYRKVCKSLHYSPELRAHWPAQGCKNYQT